MLIATHIGVGQGQNSIVLIVEGDPADPSYCHLNLQ